MERAATISRTVQPAVLIVSLAAVVGAIFFHHDKPVFVSSEVKFTDASPGGLLIMPASCPSDPHWSGMCDLSNCEVTVSPTSITKNPNETVNVTLSWRTGRPGDANDAHFASGRIDGDNNADDLPVSGSVTTAMTLNSSFEYVYRGEYYNSEGAHSGNFWCSALLTVSVCPNPLGAAPSNSEGYQLPTDNNKQINKNTSPICITNTSGNNYFVPASTSIEIESFKTNLPPGATYEVLP